MTKNIVEVSPTSDASAFAAAMQADEAAQQDHAFELAGQEFVSANGEISGNLKGGAGYFAEVHHTASYNIAADAAGQTQMADRLDSHVYASVDIATPDDRDFNPKYYATPQGSYHAGMVLEPDDTAKYAGQTIVVPPEQLVQVQTMHDADMQAAMMDGDQSRLEALQSVQFSDHVTGVDGVASQPLSYMDAQQGAESMRQGLLPGWVGESMSLPMEALDGALISAGMYAGVQLAPALLRMAGDLARGQHDKNSVSFEAKAAFELLSKDKLAQAAIRGGGAAAVAGLDLLDPIGAAFVVNALADVIVLAHALQKGELSEIDFQQRLKTTLLDRGLFTGITAGSVWVLGPIGLLVPIAFRLILNNESLRAETLRYWHDLNQNIHDDLAQAFTENESRYQLCLAQIAASHDSPADQQKSRRALINDMAVFEQSVRQDVEPSQSQCDQGHEPPRALSELQLDNTALLSAIERQQVDAAITLFVDQNQHNKKMIEEAASSAVQVLSPVEGNAAYVRDKGRIGLLWSAVTGEAQALSASNDHALAQAQYAALRLMAGLQQKNCLTLEFCCALQNRIESMETMLQLQEARQHQDLRQVYQSMAHVYGQLRDRLIQHESRLDNHERRLNIQDWLLHPSRPRLGKTLTALSPTLRLASLVSEFYQLTEGRWSTKELFSLQQMLGNAQLDEHVLISVTDFCSELATHQLRDVLLGQLTRSSTDKQTLDIQSPQGWLAACHYRTLPDMQAGQIREVWGYAPAQQLTPFNLAVDLLYQLQSVGFSPLGRPSELQLQKQRWRDQLEQLNQLVAEKLLPPAFGEQVAVLQAHITAFRLTVPLIGKFSTGKSTLINTWLGEDIQAQDLAACTSTPTEFHYAAPGNEKMVAYIKRNSGDAHLERHEFPLGHYQALLKDAQNIHHLEIHRHLAVLGLYPDLVLVDTPGLESTRGEHATALGMYVGRSVAFILCVTRSGLGEAEKAFMTRQQSLGQQVLLLVCQEDLSISSQRLQIRQVIAEQLGLSAQQVRGCSARNHDLAGFADLLHLLEQEKLALFGQSFADEVELLLSTAETQIEQQLSYDGDVAPLKQKIAKIEESRIELQSLYQQERGRLLSQCEGSLAEGITRTVEAYLHNRQSEYLKILKAGQPLDGALAGELQNAMQLATQQHLEPLLQESARKLSVSLRLSGQLALTSTNMSLGNVSGELAVSTKQLKRGLPVVGMGIFGMDIATGGFGTGSLIAGLGTIALPIVTLVGAGGLLFYKAQQEKQLRQNIEHAIQNIMDNLHLQLPSVLKAYVDKALTQIHAGVERQLEMASQHIQQIQVQLDNGTLVREQMRQRAQNALAEIRQLLQVQQKQNAQ